MSKSTSLRVGRHVLVLSYADEPCLPVWVRTLTAENIAVTLVEGEVVMSTVPELVGARVVASVWGSLGRRLRAGDRVTVETFVKRTHLGRDLLLTRVLPKMVAFNDGEHPHEAVCGVREPALPSGEEE